MLATKRRHNSFSKHSASLGKEFLIPATHHSFRISCKQQPTAVLTWFLIHSRAIYFMHHGNVLHLVVDSSNLGRGTLWGMENLQWICSRITGAHHSSSWPKMCSICLTNEFRAFFGVDLNRFSPEQCQP